MKEIYEWLYDEYAEAALCQEPLFQDHVLEEVLAAAPEDIRLGLFDQVRWMYPSYFTLISTCSATSAGRSGRSGSKGARSA